MAIVIKELQQIANSYTETGYIYKDLALDIQQTALISPGFPTTVPGTDIKASFDLAAIINSLQNLFNTLPGQRFLFPEYGLNLYQFLFTPITNFNAQVLGDKILRSVEIYEPRVLVRRVNVQPDPDNNQYFITIVIELPALNIITETAFSLDTKKQSFIYLPNSKNT